MLKMSHKMQEFRLRISSPLFLTFSLITIHAVSAANDTMSLGRNITNDETLVSSAGVFELGLWSPGSSSENWYVATWYKNGSFPVVVWIANRQAPLTNKSSAVFKFIEPGILVLLNDHGGIVWSSTTSRSVKNPVAQLLDTGNLVIKDSDDDSPENFSWQSFDHPTDTYLPGMKMGWNLATGVETYLSSWTSDDDPSPGKFSLHVDPTGYPQIVVKEGGVVHYRVAPMSGTVELSGPQDSRSRLNLLMNEESYVYYSEDVVDGSALWRSRLSQTGFSQRFAWNYVAQDWFLYRSSPGVGDACGGYNFCGAYGSCSSQNSRVCGCLDGFVAGSSGCSRRSPLVNCSSSDVFSKNSGIRLPDSRNSVFINQSVGVQECEMQCLRNCSCMAYTQMNIVGDHEGGEGKGCLFYYGDLIDIKNVSADGNVLYVRMNNFSESGSVADKSKGNRRVILIASSASAVGVIVVVLLVGLILVLYVRKGKKTDQNMPKEEAYSVSQQRDSELPLFSLSTILKATDNFSTDNRLGEGGFGEVYRGLLDDGEEIAVKRLSKTSSQGVEELKNEVILIAKLQHRNLVRLLGCCVEGEENMLVYEYMPNKSLNQILFDETKSMLLDWPKRFNIINGIAKGLLYLHQDSRLRIIHRDLKASNILLDHHMNPRISDFGLARSFPGNETQVKTHKVIGTYGYMPPEYAVDGLFSVKSDVFSFGVLVLEVVSGKRNRGFSINDHHHNLVGHAWKLANEENPLALVDGVLGEAFDVAEVLRSIHVALLCVQKFPEDRPNMSSVVFMLGNEQVAVPQAKEPGFFQERDVHVTNYTTSSSSSINPTHSPNELTITFPHAR